MGAANMLASNVTAQPQMQTMQPQMDMRGGIGQILPTPQAPEMTIPDEISQNQEPIQVPEPPRPTVSDDPTIKQKMLKLYNQELDRLGSAGLTKEEQRSQKALSLFANIVAPAMAAFGKGGVSAAGVQLMNQARVDLAAKRAESAKRIQDSTSALRALNEIARVDNDEFHKQVRDNLQAETLKTRKENADLNRQLKESKQEAERLHKIRADAVAEFNAQTKAALNPSKIKLNEAGALKAGASTDLIKESTKEKQLLNPLKAADLQKKTSLRDRYIDVAEKNANNAVTRTEQAGQPKPESDAKKAELNMKIDAGWQKAMTLAKLNGTVPPTKEEYTAKILPPTELAKNAPQDNEGLRKYLLAIPDVTKRKQVLDELRKLQQ